MAQATPSYGLATGKPEKPIVDALVKKYGHQSVVWPIALSDSTSTLAYIYERNSNNLINSQGDIRPKSNSGVGEFYLDYTAQPRLIVPNEPLFSQFIKPQFNNSYDYILSSINRGYSTVDLDYVWHNGRIFRGFELTTYWVDFSSEAEAKRLVSTMNRRPSWSGPNGAHALHKVAAASQDLNIEYHMVFANTVGKVGSALKTNGSVLYFPLTAAAVNLLSKGQVPSNSIFCSFQSFIDQI